MLFFVKIGVFYGFLAFCAGFLLGVIRELIIIPLFGYNAGFGLELVLMVAAIWLLAHCLTPHSASLFHKGLIGLAGLCVVIIVELIFSNVIMGINIEDYLASHMSLRGMTFLVGLVFLMTAPLLIRRFQKVKS